MAFSDQNCVPVFKFNASARDSLADAAELLASSRAMGTYVFRLACTLDSSQAHQIEERLT